MALSPAGSCLVGCLQVVTLWYRSPELLLGSERYTDSLDMWAVGCIFGELMQGKPLFPGRNELECLEQVFNMLGTPDSEDWKVSRGMKL